MKKYTVRLTDAERLFCKDILNRGCWGAEKRKRANILILADIEGPALKDEDIAVAVGSALSTVELVRKRAVLGGVEAVLERKKQARPSRMRKLDGIAEAKLIATALTEAPKGHTRWTLQLLADKMVELNIVDSITAPTVSSTLKKMNYDHTRKHTG